MGLKFELACRKFPGKPQNPSGKSESEFSVSLFNMGFYVLSGLGFSRHEHLRHLGTSGPGGKK